MCKLDSHRISASSSSLVGSSKDCLRPSLGLNSHNKYEFYTIVQIKRRSIGASSLQVHVSSGCLSAIVDLPLHFVPRAPKSATDMPIFDAPDLRLRLRCCARAPFTIGSKLLSDCGFLLPQIGEMEQIAWQTRN